MSEPNPFYDDGYVFPDKETTVLPVPEYPFSTSPTPDKFSLVWPRNYLVLPRLYSPRIANRTAWTNLLTYSQDFTNAAWTKNSMTAAADAVVAPDGETTMDSLVEVAATVEHSVSRALTLTAAASTVSIFAAAGLSRDWIRVKFVDSAAAVFSCFFNITSGYVWTATAGVTGSIVKLPGGRFRCQITFTPAAGAGTLTVNASTDGVTVSYLGDVAKGVYLWGAQAVTAATSAPYISTTTVSRAISAPDQERDINANARAQDPLAYLINEGNPQGTTSEWAELSRHFARIPRQQIVPTSLFVTKPDIASLTTEAGDLVDWTGTGNDAVAYVYGSYTFGAPYRYSRQIGTSTITPATGGTFTLTYGANTTAALNWNDSAGTIATALNALASVVAAGLTFSVTNGLASASPILALVVTAGATTTAVTMNAASLTPAGAATAFSYVANAITQSIYIASRVTLAAHGFNAANPLLAYNGQFDLLTATTLWSVIDSNTIAFWNRGNITPVYTVFGQNVGSYSSGSVLSRAKRVTDFYLPGVSVGITTMDDIPLPTFQGDSSSILAAILAGTTSINLEVGELTQWRDSPILMRTTTTLNATQL